MVNLRYNRRSIRLKDYDYSRAGIYFITICTHNRNCLFGIVQGEIMVLNEAGFIANECWRMIPKHFPNAILHEYIIMPNHIHGIIELKSSNVGTENFLSLRNEFQKVIPRSICSIVRGFKIGVTKWFREDSNIKTIWQRNYYEHIIRDFLSYKDIANYIINNPKNWIEDKLFK